MRESASAVVFPAAPLIEEASEVQVDVLMVEVVLMVVELMHNKTAKPQIGSK
jgi:hypothetical protein